MTQANWRRLKAINSKQVYSVVKKLFAYVVHVNITCSTVAPRYNEPRYNEQHLKAQQNYSTICGNKPNELILTVPTHNLPCYNECFVLSHAVSKNDMMIQMVDKPNTTRIGQDRETLIFKALLYLNVAVHAQVCRLFCAVYIPLFSLVIPL